MTKNKFFLLFNATQFLLLTSIYSTTLFALPQFTTQLHGFISQGYVKTSDNQFFGDSESGSSEFTELGINVSRRFTPRLQLSAQLLSRKAGETDDGSLHIDYALVDYELFSDNNSRFGLRAGRLKNPIGFYNATRDVAHTRPSILLPQSIYLERARNLFMSSDMLSLYANHFSDEGELSFIFGISNPLFSDDKEFEISSFGTDWGGGLEGDTSFISQLEYSLNGGQWNFLINIADINFNFVRDPSFLLSVAAPPFPLSDPNNGKSRITPVQLGIQYNAEKWHFTSEIVRFKTTSTGYSIASNPLFSDQKITSEGYYFQWGYRFNSQWELLLRRDESFVDTSDRDGTKIAAASAALPAPFGPIPAHKMFAKGNTVSLRWSINSRLMLQAEFHDIQGTAWLSSIENSDTTKTSENWNLFIMSGSYRF